MSFENVDNYLFIVCRYSEKRSSIISTLNPKMSFFAPDLLDQLFFRASSSKENITCSKYSSFLFFRDVDEFGRFCRVVRGLSLNLTSVKTLFILTGNIKQQNE